MVYFYTLHIFYRFLHCLFLFRFLHCCFLSCFTGPREGRPAPSGDHPQQLRRTCCSSGSSSGPLNTSSNQQHVGRKEGRPGRTDAQHERRRDDATKNRRTPAADQARLPSLDPRVITNNTGPGSGKTPITCCSSHARTHAHHLYSIYILLFAYFSEGLYLFYKS